MKKNIYLQKVCILAKNIWINAVKTNTPITWSECMKNAHREVKNNPESKVLVFTKKKTGELTKRVVLALGERKPELKLWKDLGKTFHKINDIISCWNNQIEVLR